MNTRFIVSFSSSLVMVLVLLSSAACGLTAGYANTPEGVTRKLFDSLQENDADKYLDSITPEDRSQPGFFYYRQLIQGLFAGFGLGSVEAAKLKISFADLDIKETSRTGDVAVVAVAGKLRDLNLAIEQDFATQVIVKQVDGNWLVDLSPEGVTTSPSGEVQVAPPQDPCRGWKFHLVQVGREEGGGWIQFTGTFAVENASSELAPSLHGMGGRDYLGEFTLTTAEGYTYPVHWVYENAFSLPAPRGIQMMLATFDAKAASGTTKHIIHTKCGTLDVENPETDLRYPTGLSMSSFLNIGDPLVFTEGVLTVTSATGSRDCGNYKLCVYYTFTNANQGYETELYLLPYAVGSDGMPQTTNIGVITITAGPGQTVERNVGFNVSSVDNVLVVFVNNKETQGYAVNMGKVDATASATNQAQVPVIPTSAQAVSSPDLYRVVHVASSDVLNIRKGPGVKYAVVGKIPYNGQGIQITGDGRSADNATWVPIIYDGISGWVNRYYLQEQ
jgi:SH3 domain-containing protein